MKKGVISQGIVCPYIHKGDDIVSIVVDSVLNTVKDDSKGWHDCEGNESDYPVVTYDINDMDVIGITESVIARAAGQYITVDDIANDIEKKFGKDATICLVNPIYSRNRFSIILKGIARAAKKIFITMPEYDEVGNPKGVNPFTGVNIEEHYKEICNSEGCECIITTPPVINISNFIYCGLHDYTNWCNDVRFKRISLITDLLVNTNGIVHYTLVDICSDVSPDWGVLGTNKATDNTLKLFPSKELCNSVCQQIKDEIFKQTGKETIVMVYGDGCFKDPVGGIWEFADPVTSPGYTDKELLESTPCEVKLKNLIDEHDLLNGLNGEKDYSSIEDTISIYKELSKKKESGIKGQMGTTPRLYRNLLASLMDLTSGSGDRATPVVLIKNYF